jgi:hypothetical protein
LVRIIVVRPGRGCCGSPGKLVGWLVRGSVMAVPVDGTGNERPAAGNVPRHSPIVGNRARGDFPSLDRSV